MAGYGFELSERFEIPVLMRFVTRLSHSRATVEVDTEARPENALHYPSKTNQWVLMPGNSKRRYPQLIADFERLKEESEKSPYNKYVEGKDRRLGIIASGIGFNYLNEAFGGKCPFPVVKISQYPLPEKMIARLADECDALLVVEEGQPFIEPMLRGILPTPRRIFGKLSGQMPRTGELNPDNVKAGLKATFDAIGAADACDVLANPGDLHAASDRTVPRPPALCQGCGHRDVYAALNATLDEYNDAKVFGDIGCYTLGWLSPFNAIDTVVDMGASITMAKGAADSGQHPAVAIIGDSTFTHSGMTGLLDAINENTPMTVIISDNLTTGMTGGQDSQGTGKLVEICTGLGADPAHVRTIDSLPKNHEEMKKLFKEEIDYKGLSVIISVRECIQTARRHAAAKAKAQKA